jgi:hypothetical protein
LGAALTSAIMDTASTGKGDVVRICRALLATGELRQDAASIALYYACHKGNAQVAMLLLSSFTTFPKEVLASAAAAAGSTGILAIILEIVARMPASSQRHALLGALKAASQVGDDATVERLISRLSDGGDADDEAEGGDANSSLCCAAAAGHASTVSLLLDKLSVRDRGDLGYPLRLAARYGNVTAVRRILQADKGPRPCARDGPTGAAFMAIWDAIASWHIDVARLLLGPEGGADADTAIHAAALHDVPDVVDIVADVSLLPIDATGPMCDAIRLGHCAVAKRIMACLAYDVNVAICHATTFQRADVLHALLSI